MLKRQVDNFSVSVCVRLIHACDFTAVKRFLRVLFFSAVFFLQHVL